jgi:hypothetical protein
MYENGGVDPRISLYICHFSMVVSTVHISLLNKDDLQSSLCFSSSMEGALLPQGYKDDVDSGEGIHGWFKGTMQLDWNCLKMENYALLQTSCLHGVSGVVLVVKLIFIWSL